MPFRSFPNQKIKTLFNRQFQLPVLLQNGGGGGGNGNSYRWRTLGLTIKAVSFLLIPILLSITSQLVFTSFKFSLLPSYQPCQQHACISVSATYLHQQFTLLRRKKEPLHKGKCCAELQCQYVFKRTKPFFYKQVFAPYNDSASYIQVLEMKAYT